MATLAALYGAVVYLFFLATFVYAIGFVGNLPLLPKTIDSGHEQAVGDDHQWPPPGFCSGTNSRRVKAKSLYSPPE